MKLTYLCILSLSTQLLFAQNFSEVLGTPFEGVEVGSIAFSDIDGDGDQDVFITGSNSSLSPIAKLYANDGTGIFSEFITSETSFVEAELSSIAFSDVDGDNHPDILIAGQVSSLASVTNLYINSGGTGAYDHVPTPFEGVSDCSIAFSDVDGDNDQDVLITGLNSSGTQIAKLYTNDGTGTFSEVTGTPFEEVDLSSIAFSDVDGDSDEDVLITGFNYPGDPIAKLYLNDGTGTFSEVAGTPFEGVAIGSIAFSDVDGDNDPDVLITGANSATTPIAKLYINDGAGTFTEVTGTIFEGVFASSIAFSDVDGDNDQDVLITGQNSSSIPIAKLYTNDGMGNFSEVTETPFEGVASSSIAFADVDGDNDQDVLITGQNSSGTPIAKLYTNDGLVESIDSPKRTSNIPFRVFPNPLPK
jgi:DNA/RNA endonuclease YhcR with UshA esterase domain/uncharacterized membrane protein YjjP (DUF1212 family)